jgi:hypothetical protein
MANDLNGRKKTEAVGDELVLQRRGAFSANEPEGSRGGEEKGVARNGNPA